MLTDHYHEREHQRHQQQRSGPGMDGFGLCEDYGLGSSLGLPPFCSYQMLPNPACSAMSWIAQSQSEIASEIALAQSGLWTPPHHMMQLQEDASGCLMPPHRSGLPHALPLDNWNYGGMDQHLVTTAVLPSMLQHEQEDGDVELLAEPAAHHFHRAAAASSSKHFFHAQPDATPDQGCYAVPLFLAEIAEQQNHHHQQQQQQAFFASSADCVREAHSSGSDNLVAESASNLFNTWSTHGVTVADMQSMHTIAAAAAPDFNSLELRDESSSVANDADNLDSSVHSRMAPHLDPIDTLSCASWIVQCKTSDSESSGSMQEQVQAAKNPDPGLWRNAHARGPGLHTLDALISNPDELDSQEPHASASKRQRVACYTLESLSKAVNLHLKKEALVKGSPTTTLKSTTRLRASMPATVPAQPLYKDAGVISRDFRILSQRAHTSQDNVATRHHPGPLQSSLLDHRDCVTVADSKICYRKIPATSVEPQSVAARQRRKKITERVNVLAQLIPGGHKMDTASMFDEAIEYVKFLQLQVNILESLGNIADQAQSPAVSSSSNTGYAFDLPKDMSIHPAAASGYGMKSLSARSPTSSPLVLSEVLQQQLFKQKLCIVSLRQCALSGSSS